MLEKIFNMCGKMNKMIYRLIAIQHAVSKAAIGDETYGRKTL
jgi:hypothetical protein